MWLPTCPGGDEELRQGDLLADLRLLKVKLPLKLVTTDGAGPSDTADAILPTKRRHFLVVSQCCTIENHGSVALAPVISTQRLRDGEEAPYLADHPPGPDEPSTGYVFNAHALEPVLGALQARPGHLWIADLTQTISVDGVRSPLQDARVARMNTLGRAVLRRRLAAFWGRGVAEDLRELSSDGPPALSGGTSSGVGR